MKRSLLIGAVTVIAFAAFANAGRALIGARKQIDAMGGAYLSHRPVLSARALPEAPAGGTRGAAPAESIRVAQEEQAGVEPAAPPGSGFDPAAAIHAAADQDPGLAELLNNPDPAVGAAIRDFVTSVEPPGAH